MIGYFSSGTGFAGIFGSGLLIIMKAIKVPDYIVYALGVPTIIPYFYAFYWLDKQAKTYRFVTKEQMSGEVKLSEETALENPTIPSDEDFVEAVEGDGVSDNIELSFESFKTIWGKGAGFLMCNLAMVYYLEYTITTGFTQGTAD
jgi:hypothetical protein